MVRRKLGADFINLLIVVLGCLVSICGFLVCRELNRQDAVAEGLQQLKAEVQSLSYRVGYIGEAVKKLERSR